LSWLQSSPQWNAPRDVRSLEWFASATDICGVYASLLAASQRPGQSDISTVLTANDGGLGLAPGEGESVWFKGGSEPGGLTLNYLATTHNGRSYVVSVLANDASAPIAEPGAEIKLLGAVKGAFQLAAALGGP